MKKNDTAKELIAEIKIAKSNAIYNGDIRQEKELPVITDADVPYILPQDWEWVRLGEYALKVTDYVASGSFASLKENVLITNEPNYAVMVKTADFTNGFTKNLTYTDKKGYDFLKNSNLFGGELILSNIGSIGKVFIVPKLDCPMTLASNTVMVKLTDDELIKYLYYYFISPLGQRTLMGISSGTSMMKFNKTQLKNIVIPIAPLGEQKKIVALFDKLSEVISLRKEQLTDLDELIKSRFIELFGDLHSTNFPRCKMADICGIKHGYAFSGEFFAEEDNNILLVTPGNFKVGGGFQEKKCKFFTGEYSEEYVLNSGDLIVTMTDLSKNMDTLGYSAIVPHTDRVYLHNQRIGLFVNMSEKINRVFLMYFMQTKEYRDSIIASATGSTVHHTSPSKILDSDMFVPPIELQEQFAAFVEQTDKSKFAVQKALDEAQLLMDSLMQKYFG